MSIRRALVLLAGIVLLGLNVSFPYTSYPEKEFDDAGRLLRSTVRHGFMPLWEARERHERAALKGNPFDDTIILWHWVTVFAVLIVAACGWAWVRVSGPQPHEHGKT